MLKSLLKKLIAWGTKGFPEDMYLSFTVLENKLLLLPDERSEIHSFEIDDITFEYGDVIGEVRFRVYPFGEMGIYI